MVISVADAAAGGDQGATADGRPESANNAATADQLCLMVIRSRRRIGHHRHAAATARHGRLEVTTASEHHLVARQMVLEKTNQRHWSDHGRSEKLHFGNNFEEFTYCVFEIARTKIIRILSRTRVAYGELHAVCKKIRMGSGFS